MNVFFAITLTLTFDLFDPLYSNVTRICLERRNTK